MAKKRSKAWRAAKARRNGYKRKAEQRRKMQVIEGAAPKLKRPLGIIAAPAAVAALFSLLGGRK